MKSLPFGLAPAVMALMAGAALAQTAPQTSATSQEAMLRAKGETYHRAPDSKQNPSEVTETQRLNAAVAARNEAADRHDAVVAQSNAQQQAAYEAERAQYQEERALTEAEQAAEARAIAAFNADQRARYEKAMADWRATTQACRMGDTARCRAGQQRPIVTDF